MVRVLLPISRLLGPLCRLVPPMHRWQVRARIRRWQRMLSAVDFRLRSADGAADLHTDIASLTRVEMELEELSPPVSLREELSRLRLHVAFALDRLWKRQRQNGGAPRRAA